MPDHRLARTSSGYEGYVYQPVRPNPPVIFDCAQVAKTWRDHYEPETKQPERFDVDWKNVSHADYRNELLAPSRDLSPHGISQDALAVCMRNQAAYRDAMNRFYAPTNTVANVR